MNKSSLLLSLLLLHGLAATAQLIVPSGATLTVGKGSTVPVIGMDVIVLNGGRINNNGVLFVTQNLSNDGILATEVCGPESEGAGTSFGQFTVANLATLQGNSVLEVSLAPAYTPGSGQSYTVILADERENTFGTEGLPSGAWTTDYTNDSRVDVRFGAGTLPVDWLTFTAATEPKAVRLEWSTAREENSEFYAVERSAEAGNWHELGTVAAAGTSGAVRTYTYYDRAPVRGANHYRLRQVDRDGRFSYSQIVATRFAGEEREALLFPNPATTRINFTVPADGDRNYVLADPSGRALKVGSITPGTSRMHLDLPLGLPPGTYYLRIGSTVRSFQIR